MDEYKYLAIVEWAKKYIEEQGLRPDDRFLSENELCSIHNVSRQTVRQALKMLENENVICRVRGSGTFVKEASAAAPAERLSVGVISTYFSDYIFPSIVTGIESVLKRNNTAMQLSITQNQVFEETQALRNMINHGVSGLIIEPSKSALPNPNRKLYDEIKAKNIPVVFFNAKYPWADFPCVMMDDIEAGKLVTDYLFHSGHKKISAIFALDDIQGHNRYQGYIKSCEEQGIVTAEQNVLWYSTSERASLFSLSESRILSLLKESTAVVCYNDKLAVELLNFCKSRGISVPDDISIVGIDDSKLATICDVHLTTVKHPHQLLGEKAAEQLLSLMQNPKAESKDVLCKPELVIRDSVRKIK
ncbi:MAG: GntR family transcriptional regulator [Oscillospiraceae bacterium]|nr:GntR family transcriptional regulator [Oscillospiraceae bacterium]MBR4100739.1 GntR family transcriptional regulator [Oscillospiraceae bacterium]